MDRASRFLWELECGKKDRRLFQKAIKTLDRIARQTHDLRRFLKKNVLIQDVGAGLIKMSYFGKFGSRYNRASSACIAALPSEMPFWYILWLSATIGWIPFQVICLAHPSIVSASMSFVPFHGNSKRPQHLSIGLSLL